MSCCPGCSPIFQDGQMAHMLPGGCMYADYDEIVSLSSDDESIPASELSSPPVSVSESGVLDIECCICYEMIGEKNNCVTECGHKFCFKCLAMAMARSNACPCCRSPLTDEPVKNEIAEEDEEDDEDYDDDDADSENSDDGPCRSYTVPIEIIMERLERQGFTMRDVVVMLCMGDFSKSNSKYTAEYCNNMLDLCNDIVIDADNEHKENAQFALEDHRGQLVST